MQLIRFLGLLGLVCAGASAMTVYVQPCPLESEDVLSVLSLTGGTYRPREIPEVNENQRRSAIAEPKAEKKFVA